MNGVVVNDSEIKVLTTGMVYRNLIKIGMGGYGVVYSADNDKFGKVAIKSISKSGIGVYQHEVKISDIIKKDNMGRCNPYIVCLLDHFISTDGTEYLVFDCVKGIELNKYINKYIYHNNKISPLDAVIIMTDLIKGLYELHTSGIAHRDIKPENIMLTDPTLRLHSNSGPVIRYLDLGLACYIPEGSETSNPCNGITVGTLGFMAPELFRQGINYQETMENQEYLFASDIFALGIVFYELINTTNVQDGASMLQLKDVVQYIDIDRSPYVDINKLIRGMTEPDINNRFTLPVILGVLERLLVKYKELHDQQRSKLLRIIQSQN